LKGVVPDIPAVDEVPPTIEEEETSAAKPRKRVARKKKESEAAVGGAGKTTESGPSKPPVEHSSHEQTEISNETPTVDGGKVRSKKERKGKKEMLETLAKNVLKGQSKQRIIVTDDHSDSESSANQVKDATLSETTDGDMDMRSIGSGYMDIFV